MFGVLRSSYCFACVVKGVFCLVCVTLHPWTVWPRKVFFLLLFCSFFSSVSHQLVLLGCGSFCADCSEASYQEHDVQSPRVRIDPVTFWLECQCLQPQYWEVFSSNELSQDPVPLFLLIHHCCTSQKLFKCVFHLNWNSCNFFGFTDIPDPVLYQIIV